VAETEATDEVAGRGEAAQFGDGVELLWPTQHQLDAMHASIFDQFEPGAGTVPAAQSRYRLRSDAEFSSRVTAIWSRFVSGEGAEAGEGRSSGGRGGRRAESSMHRPQHQLAGRPRHCRGPRRRTQTGEEAARRRIEQARHSDAVDVDQATAAPPPLVVLEGGKDMVVIDGRAQVARTVSMPARHPGAGRPQTGITGAEGEALAGCGAHGDDAG